jgi:hypothetical protein
MTTELKTDYEIVLKCLITNEVRVVRRALIEKHITALEYKLNESAIENDYKIIAMYRIVESNDL